MSGHVVRRTPPKQHACRPPIRWPWRRLGLGAQWQCDWCDTVWESYAAGWYPVIELDPPLRCLDRAPQLSDGTTGPAVVCLLDAGHAGSHTDARGCEWMHDDPEPGR